MISKSSFKCIAHSSSLSLEETKLIGMVNWISHVSDFLRSFTRPFKYGLILRRYFQLIVFYFYHLYFNIQYHYYSKNLQVQIILFFMLKKSLIILSLIASFSFLSLRRFILSLIVFWIYFFILVEKDFLHLQLRFLLFFYLLQALNFPSVYVVKKINEFF